MVLSEPGLYQIFSFNQEGKRLKYSKSYCRQEFYYGDNGLPKRLLPPRGHSLGPIPRTLRVSL